MVITTKSVAQTQKFGEKFAQKIAGGGSLSAGRRIVCLFGGLGAGKTTLVQGIARGLGIKKRIISPTFVIVRRYKINNKRKDQTKDRSSEIKGKKKEKGSEGYLWHIDLYRLNTVEEIKDLGIEELWQDPGNILLIEWPEKIVNILPENRWNVRLEAVSERERRIEVWKHAN